VKRRRRDRMLGGAAGWCPASVRCDRRSDADRSAQVLRFGPEVSPADGDRLPVPDWRRLYHQTMITSLVE